ncbi:hypothetical protein CMU91_15005 [Elizabethkingia anophelis]|nr:hypothetical protein [Elizabethkingia anophelis]
MENKLIPMTDFVLSILNNTSPNNFVKGVESIRAYAEFLKQPLTLGMFITTDEDGVPLEEQKENAFSKVEDFMEAEDLYQQAKERVLFEVDNYDIEEDSVLFNNMDFIVSKKTGKLFYGDFTAKTIEDLTRLENREFTLTATAIKSIYGS